MTPTEQLELNRLVDETLFNYSETVAFYEELIFRNEQEDQYEQCSYYKNNLDKVTKQTIETFTRIFADTETNVPLEIETLANKIKNHIRNQK